MHRWIAAALAVATACYAPTYHNPTCSPEGVCPPGWTCSNGRDQPCVEIRPPDAAIPDAPDPPIMSPRTCPPDAPWHDAKPVAVINTPGAEFGATLSGDELSLYVQTDRARPGSYSFDIFVATRRSVADPFGEPVAVPALSDGDEHEESPYASDDDRSLYVSMVTSTDAGLASGIHVSRRADRTAAFGPPEPIHWGPVFDPPESNPYVLSDEYVYYEHREDIYATEGGAPATVAGLPEGLKESPTVTVDRLELFFGLQSDGGFDIWVARRQRQTGPFDEVENVDGLNSGFAEFPEWISPDACRMYFTTVRDGGPGDMDVWQATRSPP